MLNLFKRKNRNIIKQNDYVVIEDSDGKEAIGRLVQYTPDDILIEIVDYKHFKAKEVKMKILEVEF